MKDTELKEPAITYGKHYTYRDYLDFTFDEMVEIIRGKIFRMSPAPSFRSSIHFWSFIFENRQLFIWQKVSDLLSTIGCDLACERQGFHGF